MMGIISWRALPAIARFLLHSMLKKFMPATLSSLLVEAAAHFCSHSLSSLEHRSTRKSDDHAKLVVRESKDHTVQKLLLYLRDKLFGFRLHFSFRTSIQTKQNCRQSLSWPLLEQSAVFDQNQNVCFASSRHHGRFFDRKRRAC